MKDQSIFALVICALLGCGGPRPAVAPAPSMPALPAAEQAVAETGQGKLSVVTVPPGVRVFADSESIGTTPFETMLDAGQRVIAFEYQGSHYITEFVQISPEKPVSLRLKLKLPDTVKRGAEARSGSEADRRRIEATLSDKRGAFRFCIPPESREKDYRFALEFDVRDKGKSIKATVMDPDTDNETRACVQSAAEKLEFVGVQGDVVMVWRINYRQ